MQTEIYDSKEKVYEFLKNHMLAVISTVASDNTPSGSPIYIIADRELNLYYLTKSDTKKSEHIEKNNNAAITVVDSTMLVAIQAKGVVTQVSDPQLFANISEAYSFQRRGQTMPPPLSKLQGDGHLIMYKFTPSWLRVADFSDSQIFHQIIP